MKKIITITFVLALLFVLFGCSGKKEEPVEQPVETPEVNNDVTEEPVEEEKVDPAKLIIGTWTYPSIDKEVIEFREDLTGHYANVSDKEYDFTYHVEVETREYANGDKYESWIMYVDFDNGVSDQNIFWFQDEENNKFALHDYEDGGYSGVFMFPEYQRKQ